MKGERRFRLLPGSTRGWATLAGIAVLLLGGVALAAYLYEKHRTGNVYHPHARFVPQPVAPPLPLRARPHAQRVTPRLPFSAPSRWRRRYRRKARTASRGRSMATRRTTR